MMIVRKRQPKLRFSLVLVFASALMSGCTQVEDIAPEHIAISGDEVSIDLSYIEAKERNSPIFGIIERVYLRGIKEDAKLDAPLIAVNAFTVTDQALITEYNLKISGLVNHFAAGAITVKSIKPVKTTMLRSPAEEPAPNQPWFQSAFDTVLWRHGLDFLSMIAQRSYLDIMPLKELSVREDYAFVFQECLLDCPRAVSGFSPAMLGKVGDPLLVHHFNIPAAKEVVTGLIANIHTELNRQSKASFVFAGRSVAKAFIETDEGEIDFFPGAWMDGTLVIRLPRLFAQETARQVLNLPVYQDFMETTEVDAIGIIE